MGRRYPSVEEVSEIIANENGFCVFYPIKSTSKMDGFSLEEELREFEACYRPNSKKLHNVFLDKIFGYIRLQEKAFDYKQYFAKALENEQMHLTQEEFLELYNVLEKIRRLLLLMVEKHVFSKKTDRYIRNYIMIIRK